MRSNEERRPDRHASFNLDLTTIHPFKRFMRVLANGFWKKARFFIFGLPGRDEKVPVLEVGDVTTIPLGVTWALGATLTPEGRYLPQLTEGTDTFIQARFLKKQRCFPRIHRSLGAVVSLAFEAQLNYYRWLMESLPRLRFLDEAKLSYPQLYACQRRPFHRESLQLLKSDGVEIMPSEKMAYLQASPLIVPRFVDENEPWIIPWLREKVLPLLQGRPVRAFPRRLYISRRQASGRRIRNEKELLELLAEFKFESVTLEDLSWLDQIELFHGAEAIMGSHGAGLANIVFCKQALVMELIAEAYPFTFYPQISRKIGLEHHCLNGDPVEPAKINASDLVVPLDKIRERLRKSFG